MFVQRASHFNRMLEIWPGHLLGYVIETGAVLKSSPNLSSTTPLPLLPRLVSSFGRPTGVSVLTRHTSLFQLLRFSCKTYTFHLPTSQLASVATLTGKSKWKTANTHTNKRVPPCFSPAFPHQGRCPWRIPRPCIWAEATAKRHASLARVRRWCASRLQKKGKEARGGGAGGITMTKTRTVTVEDQHIKDDRCRAPFPRKDGEEQRREPLRSKPKGTRERLAVCSSSSSAVYLLLVVFVRTCTREARPICSLFQSSRTHRHVGGDPTLSGALRSTGV